MLLPLLCVPLLRWHAAPKQWIPGAVLECQAEAVVKGHIAKSSREETVYLKEHVFKVSTAMKETMPGGGSAGALVAPGHHTQRYLAAAPPCGIAVGTGASEYAAARMALGRPPSRISGTPLVQSGACATVV